MKKRIFLDTDICIKAANGGIARAAWQRAQSIIRAHYRYCVSWITVKELFAKVSRGSPDYYDQNKEPLRFLATGWGSAPHYLADPPLFAISAAGGQLPADAKKGNTGPDMRSSVEWVLRSQSKKQLKADGFDLEHFDDVENEPQRRCVGLNLDLQNGSAIFPDSPLVYARSILEYFGIEGNEALVGELAIRLNAAYSYSNWMEKLAKNGNYDFANHESDYSDTLQLFYLADENTYFLTDDGDFETRTGESRQHSRILVFGDFLSENAK